MAGTAPSRYEATLGLEVHAQLLTATKIFCGCRTSFGAPANENVCEVCLGFPGAMPALNRRAVELALVAGIALGCSIESRSVFSRKHYFYPDLPKGYQITQFDKPFARDGHLIVHSGGRERRVRIERIHMEEDAGKLLHGHGSETRVDLNRAGTPLIEIVTHPDLSSGQEAAAYLRELREILMALGVNDGNLEEGSFRADVNVSIRPLGQEALGERVELKNINSFRFVEKAVDHEIARQTQLLEDGEKIVRETRGWDENSQSTFSMRSKEIAADYRYMPEPDLPALVVTRELVATLRGMLPELPHARRARYEALGISSIAAQAVTQHPMAAAYFEEALGSRAGEDAARLANFVQTEVLRDMRTNGLDADLPLRAAWVSEIASLVEEGVISGKQAKDLYGKAKETQDSPRKLAADLGMVVLSDKDELRALLMKITLANARQFDALRAGKTALRGYFVGQVMKETGGRANPVVVQELLDELVSGGG